MNNYPIISAHEFIAQGISAAAVASIAKYLEAANNPAAARVRRIAEEVAALTGATLYGKRGYYVPPAKRMRPTNSNRRVVRTQLRAA